MNRSSSGIPGSRGRGRSSGWNRRRRPGRLQPTIVSSSPGFSLCFFAVRDNAGASVPGILSIVRRHRARERGMTFDERLERLTGRHEALTQTVDLMAAENRERDRMWDEKMGQWDKQMSQVMESIARRLHIAEIPEHRI